MERILGIDYGDVRTGIAVSDPLGITAQAVETIKHGENRKMLLNRIEEIVKEYNIAKIVIGYPKNLNGTEGPRVEKTEIFIKKLVDKFGIPVIKWNEWLTTVSAQRDMTFMNVKTKNKKSIVDTLAATHILQNYLDYLR